MTEFQILLAETRVVPVITVPDAELALPLATALVAGGLPILEITLRTSAGLAAIEQIAASVPAAVVGAGSVRTPQQFRAARNAGAEFLVSPGCTDALISAAAEAGGAFLPGAATASEIMRLVDCGVSLVKFFPAESIGGVAAIRALGGPFPDVRFCPTGGIDFDRAHEYLALPNVVCVGGSWMVPQRLVAQGDWDAITDLAAEAAAAFKRSPATAETAPAT